MKHTTLDPLLKQIRLLHLRLGNLENELDCYFSVVSLNDYSAKYEALSYVWGTSTEKRVVYVESQRKPVTENLWQALRGLRHPGYNRILWVDALCIDQNNLEERCEQVSLMKAIHTQVSSVEIWLDGLFENVELALEFFENVASSGPSAGSLRSYVPMGLFFEKDFDEYLLKGDAKESFKTFKAIQRIMQEPWWGRTWTVQDFILAKKSTFHCGSHNFNGATLSQCVSHHARHDPECCALDLPFEWSLMLDYLFTPMEPFLVLKTERLSRAGGQAPMQRCN